MKLSHTRLSYLRGLVIEDVFPGGWLFELLTHLATPPGAYAFQRPLASADGVADDDHTTDGPSLALLPCPGA